MKRLLMITIAFISSMTAFSQKKDVVDIAIGSADHTTLVTAIKEANLVTTLKGRGPFTVFAPTNEAFNKLPKGTVEKLLRPENKKQLSSILTYHVVSGNFDASALMTAIKKGKGKAVLTTVNGEKLIASMKKNRVKLTDESGRTAYIIAKDLKAANGVVHVIDAVVLPK